jgi:hypothetical protein
MLLFSFKYEYQRKGLKMAEIKTKEFYRLIFNTTVLVSALGYFVDVYDLILFGIVRVPSLTLYTYRATDLVGHGNSQHIFARIRQSALYRG